MGDRMLQQGPVEVRGTGGTSGGTPGRLGSCWSCLWGGRAVLGSNAVSWHFTGHLGPCESSRYKCTDAGVMLSEGESWRANREYEGGRKTSNTRKDRNENREWRKSGEELTHTEIRET